MRQTLALSAVTAIALIATPLAVRAANFEANTAMGNVNEVGGCVSDGRVTGLAAVSSGSLCADGVGLSHAAAHANFGHIGVEADALVLSTSSFTAGAGGTAVFSDFLTFSSTNPTAMFADVSSNLAIDGVLNAAGVTDFGSGGDASLSGQVTLGAGTFIFSMRHFSDGSSMSSNTFVVTSGIFSPDSTDALLTTPNVQIALNTPTFFELRLNGGAEAGGHLGSALEDFGNSLKVASGMNAFNVPDGVTVNAGDWLVDNRFIDPLATPPGVPEPASWALMIAGFGLAGVALRRLRVTAAA